MARIRPPATTTPSDGATGDNRRPRRGRDAAGPPIPGPLPDAAALRAAALTHLARYAATEVGLRRVLERRIGRWARAAGALPDADAATIAEAAQGARAVAAAVAQRLVAAGAIDDTAFAAARTARLRRSGRSRRAIAANLGAKGVAAATAATLLPDDPAAEIDAALVWCRRRRVGPFSPVAVTDDPIARRKVLASLARAGFGHAAAAAALAMPAEEAAERVEARARG